jgi:hypothetical protein
MQLWMNDRNPIKDAILCLLNRIDRLTVPSLGATDWLL